MELMMLSTSSSEPWTNPAIQGEGATKPPPSGRLLPCTLLVSHYGTEQPCAAETSGDGSLFCVASTRGDSLQSKLICAISAVLGVYGVGTQV